VNKSVQSFQRFISRITLLKIVELFVIFNLAFLAMDITLAHSYNHFARAAEWTPLYFSIFAPLALLAAFPTRQRWVGMGVGCLSVIVGVAGLLFHLHSQFFADQTLKNLVYTAPFAAPLSYTGLGLILILNRMEDAASPQWAYWILVLALGGFAGNFVLSLADHAANGFFHWTEWISVAAAALAVGFLFVPLVIQVPRWFLQLCMAVMAGQILVGLLGFFFHVRADLAASAANLFDKFIYNAPPFAPMLFADLATLALLALWALLRMGQPKEHLNFNRWNRG
jgi:hypothetical protein